MSWFGGTYKGTISSGRSGRQRVVYPATTADDGRDGARMVKTSGGGTNHGDLINLLAAIPHNIRNPVKHAKQRQAARRESGVAVGDGLIMRWTIGLGVGYLAGYSTSAAFAKLGFWQGVGIAASWAGLSYAATYNMPSERAAQITRAAQVGGVIGSMHYLSGWWDRMLDDIGDAILDSPKSYARWFINTTANRVPKEKVFDPTPLSELSWWELISRFLSR